ncbi:MAG: hypothetical protein U9P72_10870 [Campylobacterota bacterium]|nr:hypothetical protein [Campylobacterota bacterium]
MNKKDQNSYSSVVSINPYKDSYFTSTLNFLNETSTPAYSKEQLSISYLNTKNFITAKIEISKNISEEDLSDAIINKVYDELALDQAIIYQIKFIESFNDSDDENRHFYLFIIDPLTIKEVYKTTVNKIKYIDIIIPAPLLLKSLYVKEIIKTDGVHCFVYFQENDAFITIYNQKEFVYTKSINYSFIEMYERFCELYGEKIEYEDFINFLLTEDLKETKSDYKKHIIKLYKEILVNVNEILTYIKRAYDIESIQHLYIGTQIPILTKFDEIAEVEIGINSSDFAFDYGFECDKKQIGQFHSLMHLYISLEENERYNCNFTTYHRPPKFTKRESGKLLIFIAIAVVIAFAYPISYWSLAYAKILQFNLLESEYTELHSKKSDRENIIKTKELDKSKINTLVKKEEQNYNNKKNTLIKIHEIKVNYPMKAKLLSVLIKDLGRFDVQLNSLSYREDEKNKLFIFDLVSVNNKNITNYIKYLTKIYKGKFTFSTQNISYQNINKKYFCELKVKIL